MEERNEYNFRGLGILTRIPYEDLDIALNFCTYGIVGLLLECCDKKKAVDRETMGGILFRGKANGVFKAGDHQSTFAGNPLACAAGLVVLNELQKPGFLEGVKEKGEYIRSQIKSWKNKNVGFFFNFSIWRAEFAPPISCCTVISVPTIQSRITLTICIASSCDGATISACVCFFLPSTLFKIGNV